MYCEKAYFFEFLRNYKPHGRDCFAEDRGVSGREEED